MTTFPKWVRVRGGLEVEVSSWEDFDELVERYGGIEPARGAAAESMTRGGGQWTASGLSTHDQSLLASFVESGTRGVLNRELGPALGAKGKGIRPALDRWSRRIGLATEDSQAQMFEAVNMGVLGRGYRLTDLALRAAQTLLNR